MKNKNSDFYIFKFPKFRAVATTYGNGLWSNRQKTIHHNRAELSIYNGNNEIEEFYSGNVKNTHAEFRVYFTKKDWNTNEHGIIYTDRNWIKDFRSQLKVMGYSSKALREVDYSEAGMQGANYVSLDVGRNFLKETSKKFCSY